jgi:DNA-binding transcriptional MerR regulator
MSELQYQIVVYKDDEEQMTKAELSSATGLHPALIEKFVEFGLIEPARRSGAQLLFYPSTVLRVRMIQRLRRDVGLNVSSLGVILDLIDKVWELKRENDFLRSRL